MNFTTIYILVSLLCSLFFGYQCINIFSRGEESYSSIRVERHDENGVKKVIKVSPPVPWKIYQFIFNFLGSLIGWAVLYYIINPIITKGAMPEFNFEFVILLLVAYLGITGNLPRAVYFGMLPKA